MRDGIDNVGSLEFTCKRCSWTGTGSELPDGELFRECRELLCPKCGAIVEVLALPTAEELLANSEALSPETLERAKLMYNEQVDLADGRLHSAKQLPKIDAEFFALLWDQDWKNHKIRILFGDREIFRQPLAYEYADYFVRACRILKEKYGYRLIDVIPTPKAEVYLWGDELGAPEITNKMRELLGRDNQPYYGYKTLRDVSWRLEWKAYRKEYDQ